MTKGLTRRGALRSLAAAALATQCLASTQAAIDPGTFAPSRSPEEWCELAESMAHLEARGRLPGDLDVEPRTVRFNARVAMVFQIVPRRRAAAGCRASIEANCRPVLGRGVAVRAAHSCYVWFADSPGPAWGRAT